MKKLLPVITFIFLLTAAVYAAEPFYPKPTGYVVDTIGILSPEQKSSLTSMIEFIKQNTTAEIAIVIVNTTFPETIESYAVKLFEQWGIGKKEQDNGILILVALADRKARIEIGYGLEPYITDAAAGRIIREEISPRFKEEKYFDGLWNALNRLALEIPSSKEGEISKARSNFLGYIILATIVVFLWVVGIAAALFASINKKELRKIKKRSFALNVLKESGAVIALAFMIFLFFILSFFKILNTWIFIILFVIFIIILIFLSINRLTGFGGFGPGRGYGGGFGGFGGGGGGFGGGRSGGGGASGGW
jgi:uncharacterized protein